MTQEQEDEVKARVDFKMNEFLTGIRNRIKHESGLSWLHADAPAASQKHLTRAEAFREFLVAFEKERDMTTPSEDMRGERKRELKDRAVEKILNYLKREEHIRHADVSLIVDAIESAQKF